MAKNFLNMFIQRCRNKLRPYTFSNTVVAQEPNGKFFEVQGVWLFRGKGVPSEMLEHDQFDYFKRRELDIKNSADRKIIHEFFCAENATDQTKFIPSTTISTVQGMKVFIKNMFK